jgi:hypothetical protein
MYLDLNLTAKIKTHSGGRAELFLNITNLLDRDPILLPKPGLRRTTPIQTCSAAPSGSASGSRPAEPAQRGRITAAGPP